MNEQMNYQQNTRPPNYLVFAILTTFFCCQILGIVSIIYAAQVNSRWNAGDVAGANDASRNAKLWAWVAFGSGLLIGVVTLILVVGFGMFAGLMSGFDF
jgi:ABC-type Fe3+ transport system permease subunit